MAIWNSFCFFLLQQKLEGAPWLSQIRSDSKPQMTRVKGDRVQVSQAYDPFAYAT